jgi:transcriptional regulator with XRE-family HTH domain
MQDKKSGAANFLGDRLRQWRKSIPMKSYELAKLIHISQGSLSDIENNKSLPSADTLAKVYQSTNINIIWLLTGKGPMKKGTLPSEEAKTPMAHEEAEGYGEDGYGKDQSLRESIDKLVRIYHQGDPEKKAHLLGFLMGADPGEGNPPRNFY